MEDINKFITDNLDIWTQAIEKKSATGRVSNKKQTLYGIKKLRELILDLAVRGKLVPQDPNDEPAFELLKRIEAEKEQLIKDKRIKKPKTLSVISENEKSFELPDGWSWCRLGAVVSIIRGITFPASAKELAPSEGKIACLRTANVQKKIDWDDLIYVDESYVKRDEQKLELGDIVMSMANSRELVGKVSYTYSIPTNNATFGGFLSVIRPYEIDSSFLMTILRTPNVRETLIGSASQTTNIANISLEKLNPLVISIPPLKEQHRIVSKVNELMTLCDQLELQTEDSITAHKTLVKTLLNTLTNSKNNNELTQNWNRISDYFDILFTTEESIDLLKQTILQLAVMGKLVPQDPNDEPASELLKRIEAEKEKLIKDKKINKPKKLQDITSKNEYLWNLPYNWKWVRLGDITNLLSDYHANGSYKVLKKNVELLDQEDFAIMLRTTNFSNKNFNNYKYITESAYCFLSKSKLYPNDIIINKIGDPGSVFYVNDRGKPMSLAMNLFLLRLIKVDSYVTFLYLKSQYNYIKTFAAGTSTKTITKDAISNLLYPLAPLNEQKRIVTKVNELMSLCDELSNKLKLERENKVVISDAIVQSLV